MASVEAREHLVCTVCCAGLIAASVSQSSTRTTTAVQSAIRTAPDGTVALLSYLYRSLTWDVAVTRKRAKWWYRRIIAARKSSFPKISGRRSAVTDRACRSWRREGDVQSVGSTQRGTDLAGNR